MRLLNRPCKRKNSSSIRHKNSENDRIRKLNFVCVERVKCFEDKHFSKLQFHLFDAYENHEKKRRKRTLSL